MIQVKLDQQLRDRLLGLKQNLQICDETGKVLGRFLPEAEFDSLWNQPEPTEDELDQARNEKGGRPLADILRDLERA